MSDSPEILYLKRALELAKEGAGFVSPNPMVGAVIVKNGKIIGEGRHKFFGGKHAEIDAFENCSENPEGADLYVNLEPCSHYGKTPPCAEAIINKKIARVIIGTSDPNPLVSGKGISMMTEAGIAVFFGFLQQECYDLNKFFFKHIQERKPYITLKAAQTLDGFIAEKNGNSKWISSEESRRRVHKMRSEYDAVLVGKNTIIADNPSLTVRMCEGRNPYRIAVDRNLVLSTEYSLFNENTDGKFIILASIKFCDDKEITEKYKTLGVKIVFVKEGTKGLDLEDALSKLADLGITSVLIEGGSEIFRSFYESRLFDEIVIFQSPILIGSGIPAFGGTGSGKITSAGNMHIVKAELSGTDVMIQLRGNRCLQD